GRMGSGGSWRAAGAIIPRSGSRSRTRSRKVIVWRRSGEPRTARASRSSAYWTESRSTRTPSTPRALAASDRQRTRPVVHARRALPPLAPGDGDRDRLARLDASTQADPELLGLGYLAAAVLGEHAPDEGRREDRRALE